MTEVVNIHQAKTQLSQLIQRVENGDEIVIARSGRPVARLVSCGNTISQRTPGSWRGKVVISEDFDDLPDELLEAFGVIGEE